MKKYHREFTVSANNIELGPFNESDGWSVFLSSLKQELITTVELRVDGTPVAWLPQPQNNLKHEIT